MIAVIATAFSVICTSAALPEDMVLASRCANATQSLLSLKCSLEATSSNRAVVPDPLYLESKALYMMLKDSTPTPTPCAVKQSTVPPSKRLATKADLRAAVKTILRGEDMNLSKPGPRLTAAKRRQIAAAKKYRDTHCGCSLHNACLKSFVRKPGGYASGKSLYLAMLRANS